jgi:hypothetical protein
MNKIAFLFVFMLLSPSFFCNEKHSSGLKEQYETLLKSTSYASFETSAKFFISQLQDSFQYVDIEYETGFLKWLKGNIKQTKFKDYRQAFHNWEILKHKLETVQKENAAFYETLKNEKPYSLVDIIAPKHTGDDPCGCHNFVHTGLFTAALKYETSLRNTNTGNQAAAWISLEFTKASSGEAFGLCKEGCDTSH